jgi:MoaA/NifB/PqqE/SkfB family radical SAM enzyme
VTFIAPRAKVLKHMDRLVGWDRGEKPYPVTVEWDLSNRCTLGCQDCHFAHTHVKGPWATKLRVLPMAFESTGDLADRDLVFRTLDDMAHADGVKAIVWSGGGEPTTHPDWLSIVEYAATLGYEQGMYTLGGLLTDASAMRLAKVASWVVVSLDAPDAETYAAEKGVPASRFAAACHGITALIGHKATVGVSFLLHAGNVHRCDDMLALARSLGASYTTFRPAVQTSPAAPGVPLGDRKWALRATDAAYLSVLQRMAAQPDVEVDLDRFREYATWQGHGYTSCQGIQVNTTITPDGRVWICPQRRGVTALGDLRRESFAAIWARHPGHYTVDAGCRVQCRLHPVNATLAEIRAPRAHEAFI